MKRAWCAFSLAACIAITSMTTPSIASAQNAPVAEVHTPEAAVQATLDALRAHDVPAMLSTFSAAEKAQGQDYAALCKSNRWIISELPPTAQSPFFAALTVRAEQGEQAEKCRMALLLLLGDMQRLMQQDPTSAAAGQMLAQVMAAIDLERLNSLEVLRIDRVPRMKDLVLRYATLFGATDGECVQALLSLEGQTYATGFFVYQWGSRWKVQDFNGAMLNLHAALPLAPYSAQEYEAALEKGK